MAAILVVEDEPTTRVLLCTLLGNSHDCRPVRTAEEGLELLAAQTFDVTITDVHLPGMSGEEFLRAALELRPGLPVIVITGGDADSEKFIEAGAFGYLLKPFRLAEVTEMVERALGGDGQA